MLDHAAVLALIQYEPSTGVFHWRKTRGRSAVAGGVAGTPHNRGYSQIKILGRLVLAHRLAWFHVYGVWPSGDIDHINGIRTDNRIANLRDVSRSKNMENQRRPRSNNTTGFLGVRRNHKRFSSFIRANGETRYLGTFDTPSEAHVEYMRAKSALHIEQCSATAAERGVALDATEECPA